jgi:hypothetical protein
MKTGTTSIQIDLTRLSFFGFLERDQWHYANREHQFADGSVMGRELSLVKPDGPNFVKDFVHELAKLRVHNRNVIISCEDYAIQFSDHPSRYRELKDALEHDWDVQIVSGYRPFFDWFASFWFQLSAPHEHTKSTFVWRQQPQQYGSHPGELNYIQPAFPDVFSWASPLKAGFFTNAVVDYASPYFPVKILPLIPGQDPTEKLVCGILKAPNACKEIQRQIREESNRRKAVHLSSYDPIRCDEIGLAAAKAGLIDLDAHSRSEMVDAIRAFLRDELHREISDLPYTCPDEQTMTDLFDLSWELERKYVPSLIGANASERETRLLEAFRRKVGKRTYCSVDTESLLRQEEWQTFFQTFRKQVGPLVSVPAAPAGGVATSSS